MLRSPAASRATSLFDKGRLLTAVIRLKRVTESEIRMAIRVEGVAALEEIEAVVLETDGSFSVMKKSANDSRTSLTDVFCFGVLQIRRCLKK